MRSANWYLLAAVLVVAAAVGAWWLSADGVAPARGIYPAASAIPDEEAVGGFGGCDNFPRDLAGRDWGEPGAVSLVAFPEEQLDGGRRFAVRLVNRTGDVVGFTACDSCLYLAQEALDRDGNWRPIELPPVEICGNSFHRVFLGPNQYWEFAARRYGGAFPTRMRFRLEQGEWHSRDFGGVVGTNKRTVTFPERGGRVLYSTEFEGAVSPSQFVPAGRE